ncbi:DUF5979 domain-containing protein [Mediterraneibacter gnavus]|uniref:DUF7601 domain-containing protein n=1 Tax=Mediterraneibacter gnavus TaxID=33038 RepID=UPI0036F2A044
MSMNKMFKKVLAVVAAGAMTMGMAMPTFAADEATTAKVTEAYVSKTYNREVGKAEKFSFTATQVKTGTGIITADAAVTIPDISFTADEAKPTKQRAKVNFPEYTQAGQYEYTVTESQTADPAVADGEHEKMIMSKAEYTMDVYVTENTEGNLVIDNIIVKKMKDDKGDDAQGTKVTDIGDTDTNGFNFTNTYVQEAGTGTNPTTPDPDYTNYGSLNVSKTIDANGGTADTAKQFDFTATFKFPEGTDAATLGGVKGNGATITIGKDGTYSFKLKTTESMKFTGVPVGTEIAVTESGTANYKGSAAVVINGAAQDPITASKYDEAITVSNKTLGKAKNTVDVTNTYNYVPTTGIIMNTLPYVLMIALCGVALIAFVGFKRRRLQK